MFKSLEDFCVSNIEYCKCGYNCCIGEKELIFQIFNFEVKEWEIN